MNRGAIAHKTHEQHGSQEAGATGSRQEGMMARAFWRQLTTLQYSPLRLEEALSPGRAVSLRQDFFKSGQPAEAVVKYICIAEA